MIKVTLWGCRGSLATPEPESAQYGGNTSCVEITDDHGGRLILDAGTGIRGLCRNINDSDDAFDILLTHLHMDHIQGMGFFTPFFNPKVKVNVWGPASSTMSLRARLTRYLSPPLFPVSIRDLPCKLSLYEVPRDDFNIGSFRISSDLIGHVGPTVGYRINNSNLVVTYLPDHEPALGVNHFPIDKDWTSGHALSKGADLLIHDAQYSEHEYEDRVGWGHSSIKDTIRFAALAKVKHLVLFHHDPTHTDAFLDSLIETTVKMQNPDFKVTPGREGSVFEID